MLTRSPPGRRSCSCQHSRWYCSCGGARQPDTHAHPNTEPRTETHTHPETEPDTDTHSEGDALADRGIASSAHGAAWPWALGALAASWVGDSLPKVVPEEAQFLAMIGGFAVAQVLWIIAFTRIHGSRPPVSFVLLLIVIALALLAVTVPHAGVLAPAVVIYGLLLAATAYVAACHGWVGALGGFFFVLSDGLIALGAFRPELVDWAQRDLVVMATYVAAQALFVATVLLIEATHRNSVGSPAAGVHSSD